MKLQINKQIVKIFIILTTLVLAVPIISYAAETNQITSNKYVVSELYDYIFRIEPKTTVEVLKNNINVQDKTKIKIYQDSTCKTEVTSGNIGTGMVLTYVPPQTSTKQIHRLSVIGDLNKNGQVETLELNNLIKYIVNKTKYNLNELELLSVDMNMDGEVNPIDLTIMIRYIVFNKLEENIETKVEAPTVVVKTGTKEVEDCYRSNVTFQIQNEENKIKILKSMYKIEGSLNQAEKQVNPNEIITLTQDGTYQITTYAYSIYGTKSKPKTKTIKIDRTAPQIGEITVSTENANTSTITVTGIIDEISMPYQISFSKIENQYNWENNTNQTFTKEVNSNGTWYVAVKDKSGNITKQSVQVENVKPKVDEIQAVVEGIVGIEENTNLHITCTGEPKDIHINIGDDTVLEIDKTQITKTPIKDENGNTIGYDVNIPVSGLKEGETTVEIIVENYDGTQVKQTQTVGIVDKSKGNVLIGKTYYPSITKAIEAINKQGTITILKNIAEDVLVPAGKEITLEIGYYTITGRINNQGKLTIPSGSVINQEETIYNTGTVHIKNATIASNAIAIHNLATCNITIDNGKIISQNNNAILNYGTMKIDDSLVQTNAQEIEAISNQVNGNLTITSGEVKAPHSTAINNIGSLTLGIKDGKVSTASPDITAKNHGIVTTGIFNWYDGKVTAGQTLYGTANKVEEGYLIYDYTENTPSIATLVTPRYQVGTNKYVTLQEAVEAVSPEGTIKLLQDAEDYSNVSISKKLTIDLNGHTITRNKEIQILEKGNVNLKSGNINATSQSAITSYMGKLKIEQANVTGKEYGISQSTNSHLEIISGTIKGKINGIKSQTQTNTIILGDNTKAINLNNPLIIGGQYGIFAAEGTQVYYYSGTIKGNEQPGYYMIETPIYRNGYIMNVNKEEENYVSKLIVMADYKVSVKRETYMKYYKTIADAIKEAKESNLETEINFMKDINEDIVIPQNTSIILNAKEHTLTGIIINDGKLVIKTGTFVGTQQSNLLYNAGETYILEGTLKGTSSTAPTIYNEQTGRIDITKANIIAENHSSIINCGTLQMLEANVQNNAKTQACIVTENAANTTIQKGKIVSNNNTALLGKQGSSITLGNESEEKTKMPVIEAKQYGIFTQGSLNYLDGTIKAQTAINVQNPVLPQDYTIYQKDYENYQTVELIPITSSVKIGENVYETLTQALQDIQTQEQVTIEILRNIEESVIIPSNVNVILEAGNYAITGRINNKGTLNVVSGTFENSEGTVLYNSGKLTVTNGTIAGKSLNNASIYNATEGTANITGGTIYSESCTAIGNKGTLTISNNADIYSQKQEYPTIYNYESAQLTVTGGKIINKVSNGTAIYNLGSSNITGGIIEPAN